MPNGQDHQDDLAEGLTRDERQGTLLVCGLLLGLAYSDLHCQQPDDDVHHPSRYESEASRTVDPRAMGTREAVVILE